MINLVNKQMKSASLPESDVMDNICILCHADRKVFKLQLHKKGKAS